MYSFNSINAASKSIVKTRKRKSNISNAILSKRSRFLASYQLRQIWTFPLSIIYYITKNPTNTKVYQKMIKCCKYFFIKNPIIIVERFIRKYNDKKEEWEWMAFLGENQKRINFSNVSAQFWITVEIDAAFIGTSIFPSIYQSDAKKIHLRHDQISFDNFLLLSSNAEDVTLFRTMIKDNDNSIVPFEKLIQFLPNIKNITFYNRVASSITTKTVERLLKIPHFSKIDKFELVCIPETFDIKALFQHIKKNKHTKFELLFYNSISEAYKQCLETIIDEILQTKILDYKPPNIAFREMDAKKWCKLGLLHRRS